MNREIKPGQFWLYKGHPQLVLKNSDKVQIMNPYCINPNVKLSVNTEKLEYCTDSDAVNVHYRGFDYFVLHSGMIISRKTGNVMHWPHNHGNSIAILRLAEEGAKHVKEVEACLGKPPVGLMPRQLWLDKRREDVECAIERYEIAGFKVPTEWYAELNNN